MYADLSDFCLQFRQYSDELLQLYIENDLSVFREDTDVIDVVLVFSP